MFSDSKTSSRQGPVRVYHQREDKGALPAGRYDIKVIETDKSKIPQRRAAKDQVMP